MTAVASILLVVAAGAAIVDWWAVAHRPSALEYVCKPLVMVALIGAASTLEPAHGAQRTWFVVALALALAGDVFLLPKPDLFVPGLASFLLAHVAYVIGFAQLRSRPTPAVFVLVLLVPVAFRVARSVRANEPEILAPVVVYVAVIASMVGAATWFGGAVAIAGALSFAASDSILALDRFDRHRPWMPLAVMVSYHVAQGLLVVSLR